MKVLRFVGARSRLLLALVVVGLAAMGFAQDEGSITQEDFTGLATQILVYLGYAIVAGLTVLVAVLGAMRAWAFMRRFL